MCAAFPASLVPAFTLPARRVLLGLALVALLVGLVRLGRHACPSEADRLAAQVSALTESVRERRWQALVEHVRLEEPGFLATGYGRSLRFGPEDTERLLARADATGDLLPLERTLFVVEDSEVEGDAGNVRVLMTFEDDGQRYADRVDLRLVREDGAWRLSELHLVTQRLPPAYPKPPGG